LAASLSGISCLAHKWLTSPIIEAERDLVSCTLSARAAVISKEFDYLVGCRIIDRDYPTRAFRRIKRDTRRISVESSYCSAGWYTLAPDRKSHPGSTHRARRIELTEIDVVYRRLMRRQIEFGMKRARVNRVQRVRTVCTRCSL